MCMNSLKSYLASLKGPSKYGTGVEAPTMFSIGVVFSRFFAFTLALRLDAPGFPLVLPGFWLVISGFWLILPRIGLVPT